MDDKMAANIAIGVGGSTGGRYEREPAPMAKIYSMDDVVAEAKRRVQTSRTAADLPDDLTAKELALLIKIRFADWTVEKPGLERVRAHVEATIGAKRGGDVQ